MGLGLLHDLYLHIQVLQIFRRVRFQALECGFFETFSVIRMRNLDQCICSLS